jgi:hypothetical protein
MDPWLAEAGADDLVLDLVEVVDPAAHHGDRLLPRPPAEDPEEAPVDVPDRLPLAVRVDQLDRVGVVGVDPEGQALGAGERRGVEGRQAAQVAGEGGGGLEGVVVDEAARDVRAQHLVEGGVIEGGLGTGRGGAETERCQEGSGRRSAPGHLRRRAAPTEAPARLLVVVRAGELVRDDRRRAHARLLCGRTDPGFYPVLAADPRRPRRTARTPVGSGAQASFARRSARSVRAASR